MRHNRAFTTDTSTLLKPLINQYSITTNLINKKVFYSEFINSNPIGTKHNLVVDVINKINTLGSTYFNNGYNINTLEYTELFDFTFFSWIRLESNNSPIFTLLKDTNKSLNITYNKTSNKLTIKRYINNSVVDTREVLINLELNTWYFLTVNRLDSNLNVYIDLNLVTTLQEYNHLIAFNKIEIGKLDNIFLTGNLTNFYLSKEYISTTRYSIEAYKLLLLKNNVDNSLSKYNLINITNKDLLNNVVILPDTTNKTSITNTYYDSLESCYIIKPSNISNLLTNNKGLLIYALSNLNLKNFTLEYTFQLDSLLQNDINLLTNTELNTWYLKYNFATDKLRFYYCPNNSLTYQYIELENYESLEKNTITIQINEGIVTIFVNGFVQNLNSLSNIRTPKYCNFLFNYSYFGTVNTFHDIRLYNFKVSSISKFGSNHIPVANISSNDEVVYPKTRYANHIVNYHNLSSNYSNNSSNSSYFKVKGVFVIKPGITNEYTLELDTIKPYSTNFKLFLTKDTVDDLNIEDVLLSSNILTIPSNTLFTKFTVTVPNDYYKGRKRQFYLNVSNCRETIIYPVYILDNDYNNLNDLALYNHLIADAYLVNQDKYLPNNYILSNLTNTKTVTTNAVLTKTLSYGNYYKLEDIGDEIVFSNEYSAIRAIMVIYKEVSTVENRSYVGKLDGYTFNGSSSGQLVGDLVLLDNDYITVNTLNTLTPKTLLAKNNLYYVVADNSNVSNSQSSSIRIYSRNTQNLWDVNSYFTLNNDNVELSSTEMIDADLSLDNEANALVLGFKNGLNGQGIVQVWNRLSSGLWSKKLHLASPNPITNLTGFGYSVDCSAFANRLFVSEIGTNKVYVYFKANDTYSAIPNYVFTGTEGYGHRIATTEDGNYLAALNIDTRILYIYAYISNMWTEIQQITEVETFYLSRDGLRLITSKYTMGTVKLYQNNSNVFSQIKSFSNLSVNYYGYSVDISNDYKIAIGSPNEKKVYIYNSTDNYTDSITLTASDTDYGYSISLNDSSILVSNFEDKVLFLSNDTSGSTQIISYVRQNYLESVLTDNLDKSNIQILTFQSNTDLTLDRIGNSKISTGLNGLFYGILLFSNLLSPESIANIEQIVAKYFKLNDYSLYNPYYITDVNSLNVNGDILVSETLEEIKL